MNEHEIARIAAALNALRPDWPTRQLQTLLADERMVNRPRRDVTVALSWVACESGTSSPYRVLEAGPWWKAAGIEGAATNREPFDQTSFCGTCGKPETRCKAQRVADDDHPFESVLSMRRRRATEDRDTARTVDELRGLVVDAKAEPERRSLTVWCSSCLPGKACFSCDSPNPPLPTNPHADAARKALRDRDYPPEEATT